MMENVVRNSTFPYMKPFFSKAGNGVTTYFMLPEKIMHTYILSPHSFALAHFPATSSERKKEFQKAQYDAIYSLHALLCVI